jgi:hypothetical protein
MYKAIDDSIPKKEHIAKFQKTPCITVPANKKIIL